MRTNQYPYRVVEAARAAFCVALATTLVALSGCNPHPYSTTKASGKITYDDGSPIPAKGGIRLQFYSQAPVVSQKTPPRTGMAMAGLDGQFGTATTYGFKDGLIGCEHKGTVQCFDSNGGTAKGRVSP
jgi:hypothetical protein